MEEKYSKENERIKKVCNEYGKNYQTKHGLQRQSVIRRNIIKNMIHQMIHQIKNIIKLIFMLIMLNGI